MKYVKEPIARSAYEKLAHGYSERAETKAENGYNEQPAIRAQIGNVQGLRVLDAGCGPGFMVRDLLQRGANEVVGFDVSPTMIELAHARVGPKAGLFVGDLAEPLPSLKSKYFDLVTSSLALDYVRDWSAPLGEFRRVLKGDGRLVFSIQHPFGSYRWLRPPTPFGVHYCEAMWKGFTDLPIAVPEYYRSFEEIINPVISAGFVVHKIKETTPTLDLKDIDPERFRRGSSFPTFMIVDAKAA